jgi:ligand-binding sensor domain-containing protein/serine phosphatase RsbU (regulator of sigma subunit)
VFHACRVYFSEPGNGSSKYHFLFLFFLFLTISLHSQTYFFDNYSVNEQLANSKVYAIIQDKNHLLWLGTPNGVSTFDGTTFKNYKQEDGLAGNGVGTIYEDSNGNIWLGHLDGAITRYNGKTFESIPSNVMLNKGVWAFCENNKKQLWVTSEGSGVILISNPNDKIDRLKYERYKGKRISDRVYGCYFRKSDQRNYFITSDAGVKVFNSEKNNFENFYIEKMPLFFPITCMFEDKDLNLWFGTDKGGLYKYQKKENRFIVYDIRDGLSSNTISSIIQDSKGNIWVGTFGGITKITGQNLKVYSTKNGCQSNAITALTEDAEGNILIGTKDNGMSIYKGDLINFSKPEYFENPQIWSILQDSENKIWFGTNAGITIYDPAVKNGKVFYTFDNKTQNIPQKIRFLKEDKNHNVWIGTEDQGLSFFNRKTKMFGLSSIDLYLKLSSLNKVTGLDIDKKGNVWIGTYEWLYCVNESTGEVQNYSQGNGLIGNDISSVYIDDNNVKYIGSRGKGLTVFTDTLDIHSHKYSLIGNTTPTCITSDTSGTLWIGTEGQGLLCFTNGIITKRFEAKDGLLSDNINLIIKDNEENIYVGSNLGLNKINVKTGNIETITKRNGFTGIEAKNNAAFKDSKGNLWFGTVNGAVMFNPLDFKRKNDEPFTLIRRLKVNDEEHELKSGFKLGYNENKISVDFAAVCLTNPDAVLYQVMLEGSDRSWQPVTKVPYASWSALAPGKYTFKVRAKNSSGNWNSKPITFQFEIKPLFYLTWWFITICIFIGLLLMVMYIKIRERNLVTEKRVLEEKVHERTMEIVQINQELAMKNKDIVDSILYAQRIQNALLPPVVPYQNTFVLYIPKDIVSGDFFWSTTEDNKELVAAVDCTGHGVPGAFMSIIGHNILNKIVKELGITTPSIILNLLNEEVAHTLHQYHQDDQIHDGMDIALLTYDKARQTIQYSGAFNPLWLVRDGKLIETRANRYAIGLAPGMDKNFINHEIALESGDTVYLFTDGYPDQFGGPKGKKLKIGYFKELVMNIQGNSMEEQKQLLHQFYEKWRGSNIQVDDILIIGRKFDF